MYLQNGSISRRGRVERNLRADGFALGFVCRDKDRARKFAIGARAVGLFGAPFDVGQNDLADVLRRVKGVNVKALAHFARDAAEVLVDARDVDGNVGMVNCTGIEKRRHQCDLVKLAAEIHLAIALPRIPDRAHREDHFAQFRRGGFPRHRKPPFDVRLHLGAESENKAALGRQRQVPRDVREVCGRARKRHRDGRAEFDPRRVFRGDGER